MMGGIPPTYSTYTPNVLTPAYANTVGGQSVYGQLGSNVLSPATIIDGPIWRLATVAVSAGGTGYSETNIALAGGIFTRWNGYPAIIGVTTNGSGVVSAPTIYSGGSYVLPPNSPAPLVVGANFDAGSGCTLTVTFTNCPALIGDGSGLTNVQAGVTISGVAGQQFQNTSGNTITTTADYTNAVMAAGTVPSLVALIASTSTPVPSTAVVHSWGTCAGATGTNIVTYSGWVSNGWYYGWTNLGGPNASTGATNYLRTGSIQWR
jgi:hypothetical protein